MGSDRLCPGKFPFVIHLGSPVSPLLGWSFLGVVAIYCAGKGRCCGVAWG